MSAPRGSDKDWTIRAKCRGKDVDKTFFPAGLAGQAVKRAHAAAKAWCAGCPVTRECLQVALTAERDVAPENRYGVFGGLDPTERAARSGWVR
ncbi:MAG: WhiB family transcriptional regulator [Streptomyces sp.]|nr:WhiB family transcriptional regulator [Streptomyces sp.]NUS24382.1 WhiB family transcriptional regulator [Streptomyces sp.]